MDHFRELRAALAAQYTALLVIGRGATSVVYLAKDLKHGREVALKVLRPDVTVDAGIDRFLHEMQIVAQLQHPNILPLYDSGVAADLLYYVMPHVEGGSLREKLTRDGRLTLDDALLITRSVGCALDYAHRKGIVHRDVKPENVLLHDGQALITDFGIAVAALDGDAARRDRRGTPEYMSPEQVNGEPLDHRTDVYSLACVLYEMLAGKPPFAGAEPEGILAAHVSRPPVPLSTLRPEIDRGVCRAVDRALAKQPGERFASMREFIRAVLAEAGILEMQLHSRDSDAPRVVTAPRRAGSSPPRWGAR